MRKRPRPEYGMALPYVLWAVLIISMIAMAALPQSVTAARIERNAWDRFERDMAVEAALQNTTFDLIAADTVAEARLGAVRRFQFADHRFEIAVEDELGKVDLNAAEEGLIRRALRAAGAGPATADAIAANIVEWRGDEGRLSTKDTIRGGPFQLLEEVRLVEGVTADLYKRLAPLVTIHAQARFVDPATAPPALLRALPGYGAGRINEIMARREAAAAGALEPGELNRTPLAGRAFTVRIRMGDEQAAATHDVVIRLTRDDEKAYWTVGRD